MNRIKKWGIICGAGVMVCTILMTIFITKSTLDKWEKLMASCLTGGLNGVIWTFVFIIKARIYEKK